MRIFINAVDKQRLIQIFRAAEYSMTLQLGSVLTKTGYTGEDIALAQKIRKELESNNDVLWITDEQ